MNKTKNLESDVSKLTTVIDKFQYLFETMDVVFALLRILAPTMEEIEATEKAIRVFENVWSELEILITSKVHISYEHTMDQIHFFQGITDLTKIRSEKSLTI